MSRQCIRTGSTSDPNMESETESSDSYDTNTDSSSCSEDFEDSVADEFQ